MSLTDGVGVIGTMIVLYGMLLNASQIMKKKKDFFSPCNFLENYQMRGCDVP